MSELKSFRFFENVKFLKTEKTRDTVLVLKKQPKKLQSKVNDNTQMILLRQINQLSLDQS